MKNGKNFLDFGKKFRFWFVLSVTGPGGGPVVKASQDGINLALVLSGRNVYNEGYKTDFREQSLYG